jgi:hypothetical protein
MALAHRLVGHNIPMYLKLLQKADRPTIIMLLYLFSGFRELQESLVPAIEPFLTNSTDMLVQTAALFSLSTLLDEDSTTWNRYFTLALASTDEVPALVRYAAAYALSRHQPANALPEKVVNMLIDAMVAPDKYNAPSKELPGEWINRVQVEACIALSQLSVPAGSQGIINAIAAGAPNWPILDTLRIAEALLDVVFFGGWIRNRYWTLAFRGKDPFKGFDVEKRLGGSSYPYGHGIIIEGGIRTPPRSGDVKVECFGYDEDEAERLRNHYEQQGHQALTDPQRQAIYTIVRCRPLWTIESDFLQIYGLPTIREDLEKFLAEYS